MLRRIDRWRDTRSSYWGVGQTFPDLTRTSTYAIAVICMQYRATPWGFFAYSILFSMAHADTYRAAPAHGRHHNIKMHFGVQRLTIALSHPQARGLTPPHCSVHTHHSRFPCVTQVFCSRIFSHNPNTESSASTTVHDSV